MNGFSQNREYFLVDSTGGYTDGNVAIASMSNIGSQVKLNLDAGALVTPTVAIAGGIGERFSFIAMGKRSLNNPIEQLFDHPILEILNQVVSWPDLAFHQFPERIQDFPLADLEVFSFLMYRSSGNRVITAGKGLNEGGILMVGVQRTTLLGYPCFAPYRLIHSSGDDFFIQTPSLTDSVEAISIVPRHQKLCLGQAIEMPKRHWWQKKGDISEVRYDPNLALERFAGVHSNVQSNFTHPSLDNTRECYGIITTSN